MLKRQIRKKREFLHHRAEAKKGRSKDSLLDNEYATPAYADPKVLITTSRSPSERLKKFHKEVSLIFPNTITMNRGAYKLKDIFEYANRHEFSDVVVVHEHQGEPDGLIISHLPVGPTLYLSISGAVLRHDVQGDKDNVSQAYPHLIMHNFSEGPGEKIKTILQNLFPVPNKEDNKRVVSFICEKDFISFRNHTYTKPTYNTVDLEEIGPRFELRPFLLRLGNLLEPNAPVEWALRPYMNSSNKRSAISKPN